MDETGQEPTAMTALNAENGSQPKVLGVDEILDRIGPRNFQIVKIFFLTSWTWAVTAPVIMAEAFLDDSACDYGMADADLSADCLERKSGNIAAEFGLHGADAHYRHWITTAFLIGNIAGGLLLSVPSDRYGRRIVVLVTLIFIGLSGGAFLFTKTYASVLLLRVFQGIHFTGSGLCVWVLGYESIPTVLRPFATFTFGVTWVIGYCAIAPLAYFVSHWRTFMALLCLPSAVHAVVMVFALPESLHYLVTHNKQKEAKAWVEAAGDRALAEEINWGELCRQSSEDDGSKPETKKQHIFFNRKIILRILIFATIWATDVLVYFGMSLFSVQLAGNRYWNYIAMGLIEIPAYIVGPVMLDKLGRRFTISSTHLGTAFAFVCAGFIMTDHSVVQLLFWLFAKFCISTAFMCIFVFASESFPTTERSMCVGMCSVTGKFIGCVSPFIQTTRSIWTPMPLVIFGSFSLVAGLVTLILPETKDKPLPDTCDGVID
uniref:MFS domain-containing protein n=1 Tax=Panagrellus redivivus TaxID=6233 RepID=A0A7E4VB51_PANRE